MLRFFRINDPYRLIFIFLILIVVRVVQAYFISGTSYYELKWLLLGEWLGRGFTMYDQTYDYTAPLSALVYKGLNLLFGRSELASQIIASFFIILQAGIFNSLLLRNKVYDENSYLPAFLYVILAISIPDFNVLSPQLMSATFVLLALRNVIRRIGNQVTDELFLSCGVFIGIASMIHLPSSIFFFVFLFSLILFSTAVFRRIMLYFFGFFLVFSFCMLYFYLANSFHLFIDRAVLRGMLLPSDIRFSYLEFLKVATPFALILILSVVKKLGSTRMTNFQQKVDQVMWVLFFGAIMSILVSNERIGGELIFSVPVVAYFWTYYFILLKKRVFIAVMPGLLVFGLLFFSVFAYRNLVDSILIDSVNEKKGTMVLGENIGVYSTNEVLSPFFNNQITQNLESELDNYGSAEIFHDLLTKTDPTYIVDEIGVMEKLMLRFPYLEVSYREVSSNRYQKINN